MPFRTKDTLQAWLDEFTAMGYPVEGRLKVLDREDDDGGDTGLVSIRLARASTVMYMEPEMSGSYRWLVTMEPRETPIQLDAAAVLRLAGELTIVSALCAFLQVKSRAFVTAHEKGLSPA